MGERYDARGAMPGWNTAAFEPDDTWQPAIAAASTGSVTAPFFESGVKREAELGFVEPPVIDSYAAQPIRVTEVLPAVSLLHSRGMAGSGLPPLSKIPHCCLPQESGPCLSSSVTDHPLRPAKDRRLGGPLPHQQANLTQAHLIARASKRGPLSSLDRMRYYPKFPLAIPHYQVDSYALLTRPPLVDHQQASVVTVRLACLRPAASVQSEP